MPVNNLFMIIQSDLFLGAKCKVWCTSRFYFKPFILYSIYCKALARPKGEKTGIFVGLYFSRSWFFSASTLQVSLKSRLTLQCAVNSYDCNSTKARWSLQKIRIVFRQNTPTGSNNKNVLRIQITGQPIRKIK